MRDCNVVLTQAEELSNSLEMWSKADICHSVFDNQVTLQTGVGKTDANTLRAVSVVCEIGLIVTHGNLPDAICEKIYLAPSHLTISLIKDHSGSLEQSLVKEQASRFAFADEVTLNQDAWSAQSGRELDSLINRNAQAVSNPQWLGNWLEYLRVREQLAKLGWRSLVTSLEEGRILPDTIESAIMLGATDLLSREILEREPKLATFSGLRQSEIQKQFQKCDEKLKGLQQQLVAWKASRVSAPTGTSVGAVGSYTEMALLKHEINKRKRHVPLRQLVGRAGQAMSALKPCFMMGPMSVAQYLAPGYLRFDLVVMDEASQVKPEEALGAIARGNQLIVVGDPKQLPPSSFFDKLIDEEENEDEIAAGQQSESILDASLTTFPVRRLKWHYRSQHESLIAFSNHAFYDGSLVIFPSPFNKSNDYGLRFTRVRRGRFVNRVNREEAAIIAESVKQHISINHAESIGVAAMNAQQREQIELAIETAAKEDAQFRARLDDDQNSAEPLFVKNLENVQGDERDVIFISMTYGPTEVEGRTTQRFGPINIMHGWRRLNVLFTRAKKRMHVFSSMGSEDIVVTPSSSRGVRDLKGFLEYAERGQLPTTTEHTGRDPDSDFEVAVADALSKHGFECVPQVGVAGYFLDIAVKDPGNPGRYLMAVECDGASYHSAKSTRDRDRLRQTILEQRGWLVRRIWSTDWFNNPAAQLAPIVAELNELKSTVGAAEDVDIEEIDEIPDVAEKLADEDDFVEAFAQGEVDLKTALERFEREVIRPELPDTKPERRLLRPAMLEALLEFTPTSSWEFHQDIPPFLRMSIDAEEGKYLKQVFEIIYESQADVETDLPTQKLDV